MTDSAAISQQQEDAAKAFRVEDMTSYRDGFRNLMRIVFVQAFFMIGLIGFDYYYISTYVPQDRYFATSPTGVTRPLVGLAQPNVGRDAMLLWASAATTEVLTFGFNDVDERFAKAQRLFSPAGWKTFAEVLQKSRLLRDMMAQQHIMTAIPTGPPILLGEGMVDADYVWILDVPMILTIRAGDQKLNGRTRVRLTIVRLPTAENPMGVGIKMFAAS